MVTNRFTAASVLRGVLLPGLLLVLLPVLAMGQDAADADAVAQAPTRHGVFYVVGVLLLKFAIVTPVVALIVQLLIRLILKSAVSFGTALRMAAIAAVMAVVYRIMINSIAMAGMASLPMRIIDEAGALLIGCWGLALGVAGALGLTFGQGVPTAAIATVSQYVLILVLSAMLGTTGINQDWAGGAGNRATAPRQQAAKTTPPEQQPGIASPASVPSADTTTPTAATAQAAQTPAPATWSASMSEKDLEQAKKDALAVPKY